MLIGNLLFLSILIIIASRSLSVISGTPFPLAIITSNSMSPSLFEGDLVAWTPTNIDDVKIGDVIVFKSWLSWPDEKLVVHRVVGIKTMWGRPALETKGDANEYTDQSGPHIPEPYIQEKRFIGKVLSVGSQPLKIPFVGYIGILITQGFNALSQPSAAKGTLTYVGVFTPLTISVVLLVISLFILPDRAKTYKEKIRLNIFETQPLNIKNLFSFFLTIFVLLLVLVHFFAFDSTPATVGVGEFPEKSGFELGSIPSGKTGPMRYLPVINPGIMPVKGIVFGSGELKDFVNRTLFTIDPGEIRNLGITATIPNGTQNGSFLGEIKLYSSPIWFIFPDEFIRECLHHDGQSTVLILDVLAAGILTVCTITLIVTSAYISMKYRIFEIDISWRRVSKFLINRRVIQRISTVKHKTKVTFNQHVGWILRTNIVHLDVKPLILASTILVPFLLLLTSELLAMVVASIAAGLCAYFIHCRTRAKIILTSSFALIFGCIYIIVKTQYNLMTSDRTLLESTALGLGAIGIYLLVLAFFLIPLSLVTWYMTYQIRNVKEQKDPLLILEGSCDL
ncbi:MAG: signal peptidase I [Candidatus Thermoplasmatota archaeon]